MVCKYVTLPGGQQIHYRQAGEGPPLVILHPSPQSSEAMMPAINAFSSICMCFALDTAGYGLSDSFECDQPTLSDYAHNLIAAIDAIGIDSFCLYGVATGSQIAIEVGKLYPGRLNLIMLDANGHMSDDERALMMEGYFPDVTPQRDGGHLLTYWDMCRDLFAAFPWNSGRLSDRLKFDLPPAAVVHDIMNRYLQAGQDYAKAYKMAFLAESRDHMDGLNVPTTMMRWEGSPVLKIADDLIKVGLPECVEVLHAGLSVEERYAVQAEKLRTTAEKIPAQDIQERSSPVHQGASWYRTYLNTEHGQVHAYRNQVEGGKPLVVLHRAGASAAQMLEGVASELDNRPVIVFDLPGHGSSPRLPDDEEIELSHLATPIIAALAPLEFGAADILGHGLGVLVGTLISENVQVDRISKAAPAPSEAEDRERILLNGFPDLTPQIDGSHIVKAWSWVRDNRRYDPWFDRSVAALRPRDADLDPESLHKETVDILRTGANWQKLKMLELQQG